MTVKFCEFSEDQISVLQDIFSTLYSIHDYKELLNVYDVFKRDFPGPTFSSPQNVKRQHLQPKTNQIDFINKYNDLEYQIGIDVPVLLSPECDNKKTVFIVGEDPLRDFKNLSNDVRLATPFGVHMQEFRNKVLPVYWSVMEHLLARGFTVYVTDFYKLWIKHKDRPKLRYKGDILENFHAVFLKEIKAFRPKLIVTFGRPAYLQVKTVVEDIPILSFRHPSRTANGHWKKILTSFYKQSDILCTDENKTLYMKHLIECTTANSGLLSAGLDGKCNVHLYK